MKASTVSKLAKTLCDILGTEPRITKSEANSTFLRIAETCNTRKQAARDLLVDFFGMEPEDEHDAERIQRALNSI